jgi:hypothetical protein
LRLFPEALARPLSLAACRSATRIFRLEEAACAGGRRKARCVVCPVCPFDDAHGAGADRPVAVR